MLETICALKEEQDAMIRVMDLAHYVIGYANEKAYEITHLKLQKILYFLQGEFLRRYDRPLFSSAIMAWTYGPVVVEVYFEYCSKGALPLYESSENYSRYVAHLSVDERETINTCLDNLLPLSSRKLVSDTHKQYPWLKHHDEVESGKKPYITLDEMREYFRNNRGL